MRLIENHYFVLWQQCTTRCYVQTIDMCVDNYDVCGSGPVASTFSKASCTGGTSLCARTFVAAHADHAPRLIAWTPCQVALIASFCLCSPFAEFRYLFCDFSWSGFKIEFRVFWRNDLVYSLNANVIAPTLQHCPRDVAVQFLAQNFGK